MQRRDFIKLLGGAAAAWPLAARAQQKMSTIGFLGANSASAQTQWTAAFVQRLRELGWIEGRTVSIEYRWAEGRSDRYTEIAAEFVQLKVNVIATAGNEAAIAAKQVTSVIPIVFAVAGDPVGTGLVASLARPGGNVTGLLSSSPILSPVSAAWRSWPISAVQTRCSKCMRLRQRPARSASKSRHSKSGERRISRPPSRRSRAVRMRFM
jgi:putative ABC transport system substrate-binding protein